jgi:hypothetical protein
MVYAEEFMIIQLIEKIPAFMETESSSPYSQKLSIVPYPEPVQLS